MRIQEVHVKNFRSIKDETLLCDSLTALAGPNGSGKSSFLSAIELFYNPSINATVEDFYSRDISNDIEIAIRFGKLRDEASEHFSRYIDNDQLTIVRVFSIKNGTASSTYHGMRMQNPDFTCIREAENNTNIRKKYNEIRSQEEYSTLEPVGSAEQVLNALDEWEEKNPNTLSRMRDTGQFFGFTNVGQGYLGKYTKFIHVPAVRDAQEDATEKKGSPVTEIMNIVVRSKLANQDKWTEFKQQTQTNYRTTINAIFDPQKPNVLISLQDNLSEILDFYAPDTGVQIDWDEVTDIPIPLPQAHIKLREDNFKTSVERTGHGLQRAFIITMLQYLLQAQLSDQTEEDETSTQHEPTEDEQVHTPNLVLAIEEPELYQHPSRQRHLASVLLELSSGTIPGITKNTQVIYTTHSPLFLGLDRFPQIRVLRKLPGEKGKARVTQLKMADMDAVAEELREQCTAKTLLPRLQALMTPWMNEGFFADVVVLVEGETDRAVILGMAKSMDHDFDSKGITVIPCFGKNNLDRPLIIFRQLGIPVYVIWDGDHRATDSKPESKENNRRLLRLLDQLEQDWPDFVGDFSACFKTNLEETLKSELGPELFESLLCAAQQEFDIRKKKDALKNAMVIQHIIRNAYESHQVSSASLQKVVENIVALTKGRDDGQP